MSYERDFFALAIATEILLQKDWSGKRDPKGNAQIIFKQKLLLKRPMILVF